MNDSPPDETLEARRRKLRFRSWHRGTREMDLVLGPFADRALGGFDSAALDQYESLLSEEDPDIFDWVTRRSAPPPEADSPVLRLLLAEPGPLGAKGATPDPAR